MKLQYSPQEILKKYWGYDKFRYLQLDIVNAVLEQKDTLALLPTGGGKSICFQVPALCMEGICIVISPLIALMKDQVANLRKRGIRAYAIHSGMHIRDIDRILDNCVHGAANFLYLSPERLRSDIARERIQQMQVCLLAVDEAHCISQWGYNFRPSYLNISEIRSLIPDTPVVALTATATSSVVEDIQERLLFKPNKQVFRKSFLRKNLQYVVLEELDKEQKLLEIVKKIKGTGIVYVSSRRQTKEIAQFLRKNGISADYYHAGLASDYRFDVQDAWVQNKTRIIVSTNAFGMGIDKPDVRVVVHMALPDSLEAYFQEAGRAGRDREKAFAVLLYNKSDRNRLERQYEQAFPELKNIRKVYQALGSFLQLAIGGGLGQTFDFDLAIFCKAFNFQPIEVINIFKILEQEEYLELSDNLYFPSTLQVIVSKERLYEYCMLNPRLDRLLKLILRAHQGVHTQNVNIKERQLAYSLKIPIKNLIFQLEKLHKEQIIHYKPQKDIPQLSFLKERISAQNLIIDKAHFEFLKENHAKRMQAALHYAEHLSCRSQLLLAYFEEEDSPPCGKCDICLGRHKKDPSNKEFQEISKKLEGYLKVQAMTTRALLSKFPKSMHQRILTVIQYWADNHIIQIKDKDQWHWM